MTGDARFCATTASMCGIEKAGFEGSQTDMDKAVRFDLTLHAMMFMQSGIPVLYSGDEIGQVNDYGYKLDPNKMQDSRYLHRGRMLWENAARADDPATVEGRVFGGLAKLEQIRRTEKAFTTAADVWTIDLGDNNLLAVGRWYYGDAVVGVFNFSEWEKDVSLASLGAEETDRFVDLMTGEPVESDTLHIQSYGFVYLKQV